MVTARSSTVIVPVQKGKSSAFPTDSPVAQRDDAAKALRKIEQASQETP